MHDLILPSRDLWRPEPREVWTPHEPWGRTRRRGGLLVPDRGQRSEPLYADIGRSRTGFFANGVNATSYNFGTLEAQPTTGLLQTVLLTNTVGASQTAPNPTSVTGNGLTYTLAASGSFQSGTIGVRMTIWRAMGTTTGSGTITVSFGATQTSCCGLSFQWSGTDTSGTNGSGSIGSTTGASNTLAAGAFTTTLTYSGGSANRPMVLVTSMVAGNDWTALTGWIGGDQVNQASPANNIASFWRSDLADTTVGATHATTSAVGMLAVELVAAATAGAVMRRTLSNIGTRTGARQGR